MPQVTPTFNLGYGFESAPGYAGMLADSTLKRTDSYAAESAIGFGVGVVQGTDAESQVKAPTTAGDGSKFVGIAQADPAKEQDLAGKLVFGLTETVPVLTLGRIWVPTDGPVTAGNAAKLVVTGVNAGKFSATNGEAVTTRKLIFKTSVDAAGLAVVEVY